VPAGKVNTVILDLDGPILDGVDRHYSCYSDILKERGFAPVPLDIYWDMKRRGINRRELLQRSDAAGFYDEFLQAWLQRIEQKNYLELDRLQFKVPEILESWQRSGLKTLLVTLRSNTENVLWQLDYFGIRRLFTEVIVVNGRSADANKAVAISRHLGAGDLNTAVWVGDTEIDITAAKEVGVKVCAVTCGLRTAEYLAPLQPDMLEPNLYAFFQKVSL
jgi:phosphoglycolate phosphatase